MKKIKKSSTESHAVIRESRITDNSNKIVIFTDEKGNTELRADIENETIFATLDQISLLFGRDKSVISRHLKNIFSSGELHRNSVVAKNATTASDGKVYVVEYYNLDAVLSVGYRVNSKKATQFRIWATRILREYVVRGYSLDNKVLTKSLEKIEGLREAIELIESNENSGKLKGKITIKLTKNMEAK
jgi:hypothetical protein